MDQDLFGEPLRYDKNIQGEYLKDKDEFTLGNRIQRLEYLHNLNPEGVSMMGNDMELMFCFREMQDAYINGHFLSTIVLGQAWIEKILDILFHDKGLDKISKKGLFEMIKYCQTNKLVHEYILRKINNFRKIRNPITHLKELDYEYNLNNRSFKNKVSPIIQLEIDATEVIEVCGHIAKFGLVI